MGEALRHIRYLLFEDSAFAVITLLTVVFAIVYTLVDEPSVEMIASLMALLVSTAIFEFGHHRTR